MTWYYADSAGKQQGPFDDASLEAFAANGTINASTLVWRDGMSGWLPLREAKPIAGAPGTGGAEAVCAECGKMFPIDDTIKVGSARVCANCKPIFVQKMREGVTLETPGEMRYAGFWIRFAAVFLDGIILGIFNFALNAAFGFGPLGHQQAFTPGSGFNFTFAILYAFELFVGVSYESFMIGTYGATVGKMACKLKVVTADGGKVGYARAVGRYFAKLVSSLICLIGFIMAGFDGEKRALHDRICNTRVVFKN